MAGLSCEDFEEEFVALFTTIEANHSLKEPVSCSKLGNKESRELRRLSCSINYDSKSGSASHGRVKGTVVCDYL